ncbi:MAG: DUF1501 domain-containing protein [Bryobacterales bacterium]|nr:DUF1501 domain-containing protein [Bryobacterales bacterium]
MKNRFGFDWTRIAGAPFWRRPELGRRMFFRNIAAAVGGYFLLPSRPMEGVAKAAPSLKNTAKQVIFIVMNGGPSQIDTFDFKDGAWVPSNFNPTTYGSVRWPQGAMPRLAENMGDIALVRSIKAWALVHNLARNWIQIGRNPTLSSSRIAPHIGSVVSMEFAKQNAGRAFPAFVNLNATSGPGSGYFPPEHSPFYVSPGGGGMNNTTHRDGQPRFQKRVELLDQMTAELRESREYGPDVDEVFAFQTAARKLMYNDDVNRIFTFDQGERNRFGNTGFGNACIAARNLLRAQAGVRFIQINQGDWDHHENIYLNNGGHVAKMREFDNALGTLIGDLRNDGLLQETLIVAMGEFGRVPGNINAGRGRDHHVQQAALFAGAGISGGKAIGATDNSGGVTTESGWSRNREIRAEDVEATVYSALGIDYTTVRKDDPIGRGFEYVPFSDRDLYGPIHELWGS